MASETKRDFFIKISLKRKRASDCLSRNETIGESIVTTNHPVVRKSIPAKNTGDQQAFFSAVGSTADADATRSYLNHDGSVRQCFSNGEAKSQSANRATSPQKRNESAEGDSIITGNCASSPYRTVLDSDNKCRLARNRMIALVAGARYVPNLDTLCIPFRNELIHCAV